MTTAVNTARKPMPRPKDEDAMQMYFHDVETLGFSPLSREKEHELSRIAFVPKNERKKEAEQRNTPAWRARIEARNELVEHNLPLVPWIAKRYVGRGLPLADLIQIGNEGLIKAAERFDWRTGNKFATYAVWWIKQGIRRALRDCSAIIRVPVYAQELQDEISRAAVRLRSVTGREPAPEEIGRDTGISAEKVRTISRRIAAARTVSLTTNEAEDDGHGRASAEQFALASPELGPLERLEAKEELAEACRTFSEILRVVGRSQPMWQIIFRMRHGLDGTDEQKTYARIARSFGISRERMRQILLTIDERLRRIGFGEDAVATCRERIETLESLTGENAISFHAALAVRLDRELIPGVAIVGPREAKIAALLWTKLAKRELRPIDFASLAARLRLTLDCVRKHIQELVAKDVLRRERRNRYRLGSPIVLVGPGRGPSLNRKLENLASPKTRARLAHLRT